MGGKEKDNKHYLGDFLLILVSIIVSSLFSFFLTTKYGTDILTLDVLTKSENILILIWVAFVYLVIVGTIIILILLFIHGIHTLLKVFFEPMDELYKRIKEKIKFVRIIDNVINKGIWDFESSYKKNQNLYKMGSFLVTDIILILILRFFGWFNLYVLIVIILYTIFGLLFFTFKSRRSKNN